jgi:drug/metabolite transporter (DMT)-like permease
VAQLVVALRAPFSVSSRLPLTAKIAIALGTVYVVWGSTLLATKMALATVPPFSLQAARFLLAGGVLYLVAVRCGSREGDRVTARQWLQAAVTGNLLLVGGTGLITLAQTRIPSGTAGLLLATVPIWMALLARATFGERLSGRVWLGLAAGLVGVGLLLDPAGGGEPGAMLLAVLGAVAWAAGSLRSRVNDAPARPLVAAGMQMVAGGAGFAVVAVLRGEPAHIPFGDLDASALLPFAYLVTAGSLLAFTAYSWLLRRVSTTLVGTYAYVNPAIAVLLGWLVAGESYALDTLLAGAVILAAVVLLVTGRPGEPVPAQATSGADVFAGERRWRRVRRRRPRRERSGGTKAAGQGVAAATRASSSDEAPSRRRVGASH